MSLKETDSRQWIVPFEAYLRQAGREDSTIRIYVSEVELLLANLAAERKSVAEAGAADLRKHRDRMLETGVKTSTINKRMSVVRTFFRWAGRTGRVDARIAEGLRLEEDGRSELRWLTEEEEARLLRAVSDDLHRLRSIRNEALVCTMLYGGLRVEEVSGLRVDSVSPPQLAVYTHDRLCRKVPLEDAGLIPLLKWLKFRQTLSKSMHMESDRLFVTERSGAMQPRAIQFVVEALAEKTGLPVTCRILRHTYCRRLAVQGASAERLRDWAGHKSLLTTVQYYEEV